MSYLNRNEIKMDELDEQLVSRTKIHCIVRKKWLAEVDSEFIYFWCKYCHMQHHIPLAELFQIQHDVAEGKRIPVIYCNRPI